MLLRHDASLRNEATLGAAPSKRACLDPEFSAVVHCCAYAKEGVKRTRPGSCGVVFGVPRMFGCASLATLVPASLGNAW